MPNHENLQAVCTLIGVWAVLFFGVLAVPQYVPSPWNCYLAGAITAGVLAFSAVYFGYIKRGRQGLSEQEIGRKKDIYNAIKEWVEPPVQFNLTEECYHLTYDPPKLASEIRDCLSRNYPSIWNNLQELRRKHEEWVNPEVPRGSIEKVGEVSIVSRDWMARKESLRNDVRRMHSSLVQQFRSEILGKHYTRLKC